LGVLDKIHVPLFEAIHVQKRDMNTEKAIEEFFVSLGVKSEDFTKTFSSFSIATKIRHAEEMTERYGITGVPAVIVNGKYRLSSEMTDGYENMLRVIDYLIEKEKVIMEAERKAKAVESMAPQGDKPASSVSPAADSPVKK
jgi:thiol:disulfide interchange protein DsbA